MRVLYVSDVYFPRVNGVSTSIRTFRADLAECGVHSTLIAPQYTPADAPEESLLRVPGARIPGDPEDRRMRWGALRGTLAALPRGAFDLVHAQTPFIAHYAAVAHARERGIPCIATYHTFFEEYLHHYLPVLPHALARALARHFTRAQCAQVAALVAPSEPMRAVLTDYGVRTPIHVIPTGLPPSAFRAGDGRLFRAQLGIPADRPLVLYVGRVAHEKNIGFLIASFARLRATLPAALFVIAGEGPARGALAREARSLGLGESVRFVGYLERERALPDCYAAADAFVFASRTETQGLVLLEAMAQGAPVISTAELGTRSILTANSGALVVQENESAFAAALARVLADPALRARAAAQGREYARTWSSRAMAGRLAQLYREARARAVCAWRQDDAEPGIPP